MNPSDQARQVSVVDSWLSQAYSSQNTTNPGVNALLADTGQLAAGYYDVYYFFAASVALVTLDAVFEHRDAGNVNTLWFREFLSTGADSKSGAVYGLQVATHERFRIISYNGKTGIFSGNILVIRRA
jgi:hypothetical protein